MDSENYIKIFTAMPARIDYSQDLQDQVISSYLSGDSLYRIVKETNLNYIAARTILIRNGVKTRQQLRKEKIESLLPSPRMLKRLYLYKYMNAIDIAKMYCADDESLIPKAAGKILKQLKAQGIKIGQGITPKKPKQCTFCNKNTLKPVYQFSLPFCSTDCKAKWLHSNTDNNFLCSAPIFYVYALIAPIKVSLNSGKSLHFSPGDSFYIGKGHGSRAYSHENPNSGNSLKLEVIRQIHNQNRRVEVKKLVDRVSEKVAFEQEIRWIDKIGLQNLTNMNHGGLGEKATGEVRKAISWAVRQINNKKSEEIKEKERAANKKRAASEEWQKAYREGSQRFRKQNPWASTMWKLFVNHKKYGCGFPKPIKDEMEKLYQQYLQDETIGKEIFPSKYLSHFLIDVLPDLDRRMPRCIRFAYDFRYMRMKQLRQIFWATPHQIENIIKKTKSEHRRRLIKDFMENSLEKIVPNLYSNEGLETLDLLFDRITEIFKHLMGKGCLGINPDGSYKADLKQRIKETSFKYRLKLRKIQKL